MRRLYSTFAGGLPGIGLLLMRVVCGSALIIRASSILWHDPPLLITVMLVLSAGCGILLIPGLWTPISGSLVVFSEMLQILTVPGDRSSALLLGTIGAALAMLGPGLWSVDARLFGWKRIEAPPRKNSSKSL